MSTKSFVNIKCEPVIRALLLSPQFQRLREIDQSGPLSYFGIMPKFSRYEHSIGVLELLRKVHAPVIEQVSGMLHDVSHTAFSHVSDMLFDAVDIGCDNRLLFKHMYGERVLGAYGAQDRNVLNVHEELSTGATTQSQSEIEFRKKSSVSYVESVSYQDNIHLWFLKKSGLCKILKQHNIFYKNIDPHKARFVALERPLPYMCADRLQYNIHTAVICNMIDVVTADEILDDLHFSYESKEWFFTDQKYARSLGDISINCTYKFWASSWNTLFYHYFSLALKRALSINLITCNDIHFGTDKQIMVRLQETRDEYIQEIMSKCTDIHSAYKEVAYGQGDINIQPKCRAINPLIIDESGHKTYLSEIDPSFKHELELINKWCISGYGLAVN